MQNVDFSWAPHARIGRAAAIGSSTLDGTYPRERRSTSGRRLVAQPDGSHDRVVRARLDRTVVHEIAVGDAREAAARVAVAERDRLVRDVPARQHERVDSELGEVGEQEMVERRVREHDAELGSTWGDRARDVRAR